MANTDLSARFEKISDKAKKVAEELHAASDMTKDQLQADVTIARDKASAAADKFKEKARASGDKVSSQWDEIRGKWQAHVAKVREDVREKKAQLDAKEADTDANIALSYALDAIDFADGRDRGSRVRGARCRVCASQGSRAHLIARRTVRVARA